MLWSGCKLLRPTVLYEWSICYYIFSYSKYKTVIQNNSKKYPNSHQQNLLYSVCIIYDRWRQCTPTRDQKSDIGRTSIDTSIGFGTINITINITYNNRNTMKTMTMTAGDGTESRARALTARGGYVQRTVEVTAVHSLGVRVLMA